MNVAAIPNHPAKFICSLSFADSHFSNVTDIVAPFLDRRFHSVGPTTAHIIRWWRRQRRRLPTTVTDTKLRQRVAIESQHKCFWSTDAKPVRLVAGRTEHGRRSVIIQCEAHGATSTEPVHCQSIRLRFVSEPKPFQCVAHRIAGRPIIRL